MTGMKAYKFKGRLEEAIVALEAFEEEHPPEQFIAAYRELMFRVARYAASEQGRLAECIGNCGYPSPLHTCKNLTCTAPISLAELDNQRVTWERLRAAVRNAR